MNRNPETPVENGQFSEQMVGATGLVALPGELVKRIVTALSNGARLLEQDVTATMVADLAQECLELESKLRRAADGAVPSSPLVGGTETARPPQDRHWRPSCALLEASR